MTHAPTLFPSRAQDASGLRALLPLVPLLAAAGVGLYLLGGTARLVGAACGALLVLGMTLTDIRLGLALFILIAGISPEYTAASVENLRLEDMLFPVLLLAWFVRNLSTREGVDAHTPITLTIIALLVWGVAVTFIGIWRGSVPDKTAAFFRIAKYVQYFVVFYLVYNNVHTLRDVRNLVVVFVVAAVVTGIYSAYRGNVAWQEMGEEFARASGPRGENYNTLSGYLIQAMALSLTFGLASRATVWRVALLGAFVVIISVMAFTHSREGYVMQAGALAYLAGKRYRVLLLAGLIVWIAAPVLVPRWAQTRIGDTVSQIQNAQTGDVGSNSLSARLGTWRGAYYKWMVRYPLTGAGIGAVSLSVDNEYVLRWSEMGIPGLGIFLLLLWQLWRMGARIPAELGRFGHALSVGYRGALVGLLVQGLAAASFSTIRTMEPFWFLTGLVAATHRCASEGVHARDGAMAA